jgi:hypothetical protein
MAQRTRILSLASAAISLVIAACTADTPVSSDADAGSTPTRDGGAPDTGTPDTGPSDTGTSDGGSEAGAPSCSDGAKNQDESDVDCGGALCQKCAPNKQCSGPSDCTTGVCTAGTCASPVGTPLITSFTAAKSKVTVGASTTLTAVFTGGAGTIDQGVGEVVSTVAIPTGAIANDTTFTLTVTGPTGLSATQIATVNAFAAPTITSFASVSPVVTAGKPARLIGDFTGVGTVDQGVGAVVTGVVKTTANIAANTTFTLTSTNEAGDAVTASTDVTVVPAPSITSFTAADAVVARDGATTLTAVFAGGTGVIDHGIGAVDSATPVPSGAVPTTTMYRLNVTNAAGDVVSKTVIIDITGKEVFVCARGSGFGLVVHDANASGNVAPKRTIRGSANPSCTNPVVVGSEVVVGHASAVATFNRTDNGTSVAAKRTITGPLTGIASSRGIFVYGDEIFVSVDFKVLVFNLLDDGDVAPKRTIEGALTRLGFGIPWVDDGELYVPYPGAGDGTGRITVHNANDSGNVGPKRSIENLTRMMGVSVYGDELIGLQRSDAFPARAHVFDKKSGALLRTFIVDFTAQHCVASRDELFCPAGASLHVFPFAGGAVKRTVTGSGTYLSGGVAGVYVY